MVIVVLFHFKVFKVALKQFVLIYIFSHAFIHM